MIIHTNAPINQTYYVVDRDNVPQPIDIGVYKAAIKNDPQDTSALLTFITGGGAGLGTITRTTITVDGASVDALVLAASQSLVAANLLPGAYYLDIIRTDSPDWFGDDTVEVVKGIAPP
jgi:hypothetical protein